VLCSKDYNLSATQKNVSTFMKPEEDNITADIRKIVWEGVE
jgi:hypothetical protein